VTTRIGESGDLLKCSFCGKTQKQVKKLIAGPGVYICDECIDLCNEIILDELNETSSLGLAELPKPQEIFEFLDQYVIGQDQAKKSLSVAVYNHYKRVQSGDARRDDGIELSKSNILILGPTGCGKTLLAQTLARMLNVPFAIADATALTEAGYVGEDVENILLKLIQAADLPQGGRKHPHQEFLQIDTTNILFIVGGAFAGLEKIIESRKGKAGVGFNAKLQTIDDAVKTDIFADVMPEDLLKFGMIPEFIGRLPIMTSVENLDQKALMQILTEPKNALVKQYQKLFELDEVELEFSHEALEVVADLAIKRGTGARGLRAIMEETLLSVMYEVPSRKDIEKVVITPAVVKKEQAPTYIPRTAGGPKRAVKGDKSSEEKSA